MTELVSVPATCMQKPTWIIASCDPKFYKDEWGMENWRVSHFGGNNIRNGNKISYVLDQYETPHPD